MNYLKPRDKPNAKSRTPSGTIIENSVKKTRTIFNGKIKEVRQVIKPSDYKINQAFKQRLHGSRCSPAKCERTLIKFIKAKSAEAESVNSTNLETNTHNTEDLESDSECFSTPPATPARSRAENKNITPSIKQLQDQKDHISLKMSASDTKQTMFAEIFKQVVSHETLPEGEGNMDNPQTLDVRSVHAMFKKLEEKFEERLSCIETQNKEERRQEASEGNEEANPPFSVTEEAFERVLLEIDTIKLKNKALKSAVQNMWEDVEDIASRVSKIEVNNTKRSVVLTGLETDENKTTAIQQVTEFLGDWLGHSPQIDDLYEIGYAHPRAKVLVFQNMKDKLFVMNFKYLLKNAEDGGRRIYINGFYAAETNEKRKRERWLIKDNKQKQPEEQLQIQYEDGILHIEGEEYREEITAPNPQQLLDVSVNKLDDILQIPIKKGYQVINGGNIFIGFTLSVANKQEIKDAYFKLRICYPKARHIVCAYFLDNVTKNQCKQRGFCDDGEHGAGAQLLKFMEESNLHHRAIFVARYYSHKIGQDRFKSLIKAARQCMKLHPDNEFLGILQEVPNDPDNMQNEATVADNPIAEQPSSSISPAAKGHHEPVKPVKPQTYGRAPFYRKDQQRYRGYHQTTRQGGHRGRSYSGAVRARGNTHSNPRGGYYSDSALNNKRRMSSSPPTSRGGYKRRQESERWQENNSNERMELY